MADPVSSVASPETAAPIDPSSWGAKPVGVLDYARNRPLPDASAQIDPASWGAKPVGVFAGGSANAAPTRTIGAPAPEDIPQLSAVPDQSVIARIGHELRAAISPFIGETPEQKMQRESDLATLAKISPTLANYAQESAAAKNKALDEGVLTAPAKHIADMGAEAGGAAAGQSLGALVPGFEPVTIPLGGAIGGAIGNTVAQLRQKHFGERDNFSLGELGASAIAGAIPGGSLAKTGVKAVIKEGVKQGVGGYTAAATHTLIDEGRLPDAKETAWATILPSLIGSFAEHTQQSNPEIAAARDTAFAKDGTRRTLLAKALKENMVLPPELPNPTSGNVNMTALSGGPAMAQGASRINNRAADVIAKRILDPNNVEPELNSQLAQAVRKQAFETGYMPIAAAGTIQADQKFADDLRNVLGRYNKIQRSFPLRQPSDEITNVVKSAAVNRFDAGDALAMVQDLRDNASEAFASGNKRLGLAQKGTAKAIEDQIERHLEMVANGPQAEKAASDSTALVPASRNARLPVLKDFAARMPDESSTSPQLASDTAKQMLQDYRDARTLIAQSHDIEDALQGGTSINPSVLGAKYRRQEPLSGGLEVIGGMHRFFPKAMQQASAIGVPGATVTGTAARGLLGTALGGGTLLATHNPEAALAATLVGAAIPSVREATRAMVLSKPYQNIMTKIPVTVEHRPELGALVIRQGAQAAGQEAAKDSN